MKITNKILLRWMYLLEPEPQPREKRIGEYSYDEKIDKFTYPTYVMMPTSTNLCAAFWRTIALTPLKLLGLATPVSLYIYAWIVSPNDMKFLHLVVAGFAAILAVIGLERVGEPIVAGAELVVDGVKAIKKNYCPIIEIDVKG